MVTVHSGQWLVASGQWLVASGDEAVADTTRKRRVLFVSRMHPKKGVMELVEAWKLVVSDQGGGANGWVCELVYTVSGELERAYELKVKARVKERVRQREWERPARVRDVRRLNWQELQQKEERDANRWRWVLHRWMFRGLSY